MFLESMINAFSKMNEKLIDSREMGFGKVLVFSILLSLPWPAHAHFLILRKKYVPQKFTPQGINNVESSLGISLYQLTG